MKLNLGVFSFLFFLFRDNLPRELPAREYSYCMSVISLDILIRLDTMCGSAISILPLILNGAGWQSINNRAILKESHYAI